MRQRHNLTGISVIWRAAPPKLSWELEPTPPSMGVFNGITWCALCDLPDKARVSLLFTVLLKNNNNNTCYGFAIQRLCVVRLLEECASVQLRCITFERARDYNCALHMHALLKWFSSLFNSCPTHGDTSALPFNMSVIYPIRFL